MSAQSSSSEGRPIWFLNRGVLVVRPRQPFVDWVCSFEDGTPVDPEDAWDSVNSFLIPEFDDPEETLEWIHGNVDTVFEIMLNDWITEPDSWPADRGWTAFEEWFEFEYVDLAWDLVDEPLSSEPPAEA
ncbi:MAG: hypothetical protein WD995_13905 [Gemmatimonadota bacterium]